MPSHANHRYDAVPPIPTYDEAIAADPAASPSEFESRSLLNRHQRSSSTATDPDAGASSPVRSRRHNHSGYRAPTVETDDEDSLWNSDSEGEAAQVRREMQELEMGDDDDALRRGRPSIFGKRIGFSLPQWRWKWSWQLPRMRIRLPNAAESSSAAGPSSSDDGGGGAASTTGDEAAEQPAQPRWWSHLPAFDATAACILFGRLMAIFLVVGFLWFIFMSDTMRGMRREPFDPERVRMHLQANINAQRIREHLKHFTSYAHLAGSEGDYALATDIKKMFDKYGLEDVDVDEYVAYINYPKEGGRAVEVVGGDGKVEWAAKIEEEETGRETAGRQTYAFHAHSKAGDVKGPLIYANYGTRDDFKRLQDSRIDTKGAIAIVRQYGPQEDVGLKIKAAELAGFVGCIVYSDPADDGFRLGKPMPEGRYMPEDGVQRGAVSLSSWLIGDPLTPGWESTKNRPTRLEPHQSHGLVKIPSLPLAWRDAKELLRRLKGHGQKAPREWVGGVPEVDEWWIGDQSSPVVRLKNEQDEVVRKEMWNVYGRVVGYEQKTKSIVIGNRRDSLAFGAASPNSGTAIMMELAHIFGSLRSAGWIPSRTIEFMSWDGGAYNSLGSSEFVEKNIEAVRDNAMAYINLDEAVTGDTFRAAGSPVFRRLLLQVMHRIGDSNQNATLRELWDRRGDTLGGLGSVSDYNAFQHMAGTSSLDVGFGGSSREAGRHPRDSSYDSFDWMDRFGDPDFSYHKLLGQVVALLLVELADRPILPFDMEAFANSITSWADDFIAWAEGKGARKPHDGHAPLDPMRMRDAANVVAAGARKFAQWETAWENTVLASGSYETLMLGRQRAEYNSRLAMLDTNLLDMDDTGGVCLCCVFSVKFPCPTPLFQTLMSNNVPFCPGSKSNPVQTRRLRAQTMGQSRTGVLPRSPRRH